MRISAVLLFLTLSGSAFGQYFNGQNTFWKSNRQSISFGVGVSNFLGELGGRDQVGTDFVYDLEFAETKPALQFNYRYQLGQRIYAKAQLGFALVGGNDALTEEIFRRNRNLSFRSTIFEFSGGLEFDVLQFSNVSRYNRVATKTRHSSSVYLTASIGAARFNPKANFAGDWYALKPYGTEGQKQEALKNIPCLP